MSPTEQHWDHEVGFLVVGSGAGGLTGALAAADRGADTLVIEKAGYYGGSTALSGGGIWVPNNPVLLREGLRDSRAEVRAYLDAVVGDRVPSANLDAFIDQGPAMLEFLESSGPHLRFQWCTGYSDYHPEAPGGRPAGRSIEPLPVDLRALGADEPYLRPAALATPPGLFITSKDFVQLNMVARTWKARWTALLTGLRAVKAVVLRRHMDTLGRALIARLRLALRDAGVPLWPNTAMRSLITDEAGAVLGVVPAAALEATVRRYNDAARTGRDTDHGRGESAYDNYYGDPTLPQPALDVLDRAPFYALRIRIGDLGTKGGLVYNENAQVLRADGAVIPGLYATGNTSAAVMGTDYAGAGATIGPAMVFGYIAARHAATKE